MNQTRSNYTPLLNALNDMKHSPVYAVRRGILQGAIDAIISLQVRLREIEQVPEVTVAESVTNAQIHGSKYPEWQCFHCGELFNTVGGATQHFGADPTRKPGCMLKVEIGKERGLLWEYRELETKYDLLRAQVAECEELRKDAERYRWLTSDNEWTEAVEYAICEDGRKPVVDEAIDEAIAGGEHEQIP